MRYNSRVRSSPVFFSDYFPPGVRWLLISNIALFIIYFFAVRLDYGALFHPFGLIPADVVRGFAIWQPFTYLFLHSPYGFGHILFNMLALWMFGADLERDWGTRRFFKYYFVCGVGAAICVIIGNAMFHTMNTRTIGASGAIYGLLLAFGVLYPDRIVLFSFLFPIKAKYFVMIMGAIAFLSSFDGSGGGVSHVAHLGGMVFGYFYLKSWSAKRRLGVAAGIGQWYRSYKLARAKRKFQVYLRKNQEKRDRWVH